MHQNAAESELARFLARRGRQSRRRARLKTVNKKGIGGTNAVQRIKTNLEYDWEGLLGEFI